MPLCGLQTWLLGQRFGVALWSILGHPHGVHRITDFNPSSMPPGREGDPGAPALSVCIALADLGPSDALKEQTGKWSTAFLIWGREATRDGALTPFCPTVAGHDWLLVGRLDLLCFCLLQPQWSILTAQWMTKQDSCLQH